ncbi:hypothetical protein N7451_003090 [Penicillium sp. IBT 35674x]|nr:hypothetical protein N7451_003090 [Penicillium sp. IBT 35674x]
MLNTSGRSRMTALRGLDWFGMFLFTVGLTVFLIGLNWGGVTYSWKSPAVLCTILLGFATLAVFCIWESFTPSKAPYIPMKLFKNQRYDALVVCASIGAMIYYAGTVLWPYVIADLWFTDEMTVGYWSCFMGGGLITGQVLGGLGHKYVPRMKLQMIVATIIQVPFVTALSASNQDSLGRSCTFIFLSALASGYIETLSLSSIALVWDASDIGLVACVMGCLRTAAGAIATSMYVSVLNNEVAKYVPEYITRAALAAGLPEKSLTALLEVSGTGNFTDVPGINTRIIDAVIVATKSGYARSFKTVFLITLPFGAIMLVAAMLTPNVEQYLTSEIARKMHNPRTQESVSKQGISDSSCA